MTIRSAEIYRYRIPLSQPLPLAAGELREREGLFLKITAGSGAVGWGEAAPLRGVHTETVDEALQQLTDAVPLLLDRPVPRGVDGIRKIPSDGLPLPQYYPSVRWAIETALLTLHAGVEDRPLAAVFADRYDDTVAVNALLWDTDERLAERAGDLLARGFRTFKMKVGRLSLEQDIERVLAVSRVIEGQALLRLDANKAWTMEQAVEFIGKVGLTTIEYIEEPLKDIGHAERFFQETLIPVAIDESLPLLDLDRVLSLGGVEVLVLKPSVVGNYAAVLDLVRQARDRALRVVFSSAFESGYGLTVIAHLAAALTRGVAAGLDTGQYFRQDVLAPPLVFENGRLPLGRYDLRRVDCRGNPSRGLATGKGSPGMKPDPATLRQESWRREREGLHLNPAVLTPCHV